MTELYPVQNDYADDFKIPPAERIDNPGALTLYRNSTGFEKALADTEAERLMDIYAEAIIDQWNPWQVAYEHLPFLAWAEGVNLWENWWDETFRRNWVARQWYLKSIRGTRAGLDEFVEAVGGHVKRCIVPPARAYGTKAMTAEERAAYVSRFPQLRIYPYVARENLRWLCFVATRWNVYGTERVFQPNGSFLGPKWKLYPTNQDAGGKYTRTATLYEPRTGEETVLTIRRVVKIDTGTTAGWGFTPGVSQYDEEVILPLEHRPNYFIGESGKYLCSRGNLGIFPGEQLPLRTISIGRSGPLPLYQAKAQYQTVAPNADTLEVTPETVAVQHHVRPTELYAAKKQYLVRARSIVTHAVASNLEVSGPDFGPAPLTGFYGTAVDVLPPELGVPDLLEIAPVDANTIAWATNVAALGGSVSAQHGNLVNNFILGLRTDGIWPRFDRIWLLAAENQQSARVDIKVGQEALTVGTPTFTANRGYACNQVAGYLNLQYNLIGDAVNFHRDSGHVAVWNLLNAAADVAAITDYLPDPNLAYVSIHPKKVDGHIYGRVNDSSTGFPISDPRGLLVASRTDVGARSLYQNGDPVGQYVPTGSRQPTARTLSLYAFSPAAVTVGGGLEDWEQAALYARLRTYLSALGVP